MRIRKTYSYEILFQETSNHFEILWIKITRDTEEFHIGSVYHPPANFPYEVSDLINTLFDQIEEIRKQTSANIFLCGDFNKIDEKEISTATGLKQIVKTPTRGKNTLDFVFTNIKNLYENPEIFSSLLNSDHRCILVKPKDIVKTRPKRYLVEFRDIRKKESFTAALGNLDLSKYAREKCPNVLTNKFTIDLQRLLDQYCPIRRVKVSDKDPWWSTPIIKYWLRRRKTARKLEKTLLVERINERLRNLISTSKQTIATKCLKENGKGSRKWWTKIKEFGKLKPSNSVETNDSIDCDTLNNFFNSVSSDPEYKQPETLSTSTSTSISISIEDVKYALKKLSHTATGPSKIPYWVYKENSDLLAPTLTRLFNLSMELSIFPKLLKKELITAIPKVSLPQSPCEYRPIAVTDILSRLFERVVLKLYVNNVTNNCINEQHAFFKSRSTLTALLSLHHNVVQALKYEPYVRILVTDLSKAFNTVRHFNCINALTNKGIHPKIINWISDFLKDRQHATTLNGYTSKWKTVNMGIGQGTIQGPILFNAAFDTVTLNCKTIRYADDLIMILKPQDDPLFHLEDMSNKAKAIGLKMNLNKTKEMLITKAIKEEDIPGIEGIERTNNITYLGVKLSNKLSLDQHIRMIVSRANKTHFLLARMKNLGLSGAGRDALYNSFVLSGLTYALPFLWTLMSNQEKRKIQKVIDKAHDRSILTNHVSIKEIAIKRIEKLYHNIVSNPNHILYPLAPRTQTEGRRTGRPIVQFASTVREQRTFFIYCSILLNDIPFIS